jgi:hypothetical protein
VTQNLFAAILKQAHKEPPPPVIYIARWQVPLFVEELERTQPLKPPGFYRKQLMSGAAKVRGIPIRVLS